MMWVDSGDKIVGAIRIAEEFSVPVVIDPTSVNPHACRSCLASTLTYQMTIGHSLYYVAAATLGDLIFAHWPDYVNPRTLLPESCWCH